MLAALHVQCTTSTGKVGVFLTKVVYDPKNRIPISPVFADLYEYYQWANKRGIKSLAVWMVDIPIPTDVYYNPKTDDFHHHESQSRQGEQFYNHWKDLSDAFPQAKW